MFPDSLWEMYTSKQRELLKLWYEQANSCCWWWLFENVAVISERPLEIHIKKDQLHKDNGAAFVSRDGWKMWYLNGVEVPQWLAEKAEEEINPLEFTKIKNVEVRREFVRKVGIDRIVFKCGAKSLDKQDSYELLLVDLKGETGKWPYLKMLNPSINTWHLECVDRTCQTVEHALNWRNQSQLKPTTLT